MKISKTPKITPDGPPAAAGDEYVWTELVPRLLNPGALSIIQTLLRERRPLLLTDLSEKVKIPVDHARYHCEAMERRGVLEVVKRTPEDDGEGDEVSYFFPKRSQAASSPSPAATE